jgi:hypothetical protein
VVVLVILEQQLPHKRSDLDIWQLDFTVFAPN